MSHYEVKFSGTPREMEAQAWDATKKYLGPQGVADLMRIKDRLRNERRTMRVRYAHLFCMFRGIRGYYPERAVKRYMIGG